MKESETSDPRFQMKIKSGGRARCNSQDLTLRLNKIEGQIKGINKMVVNEECCDDILVQVNAAQAALYSVGRLILENHIQHSLKDRQGAVDDQTIDDLFVSIKRLHQIGN
ncbi:MAG: metal-sensitive transcriptional regulator [Anaerolineaceae bacterium]